MAVITFLSEGWICFPGKVLYLFLTWKIVVPDWSLTTGKAVVGEVDEEIDSRIDLSSGSLRELGMLSWILVHIKAGNFREIRLRKVTCKLKITFFEENDPTIFEFSWNFR